MRRILLLALILLGLSSAVEASEPLKIKYFLNVADIMPDGIKVNGSSQGMAVWGRYAFLLHDQGQCVVVDIKRKRYVATYMLDQNQSHCNNASFGVEYNSKDSQFPLLYISECKGSRACLVTDVTLNGSRLVQKIYYDGADITGPADWFVDRKKRLIYLYCTIDGCRTLKRFRLPRLSDSDSQGEVHLQQSDALADIQAKPVGIPQGSMAYKNLILLPTGVPTRSECELHFINARRKNYIESYSLDHIGLEPEGIAFYGGTKYISFHTPGSPLRNVIYTFKLPRR